MRTCMCTCACADVYIDKHDWCPVFIFIETIVWAMVLFENDDVNSFVIIAMVLLDIFFFFFFFLNIFFIFIFIFKFCKLLYYVNMIINMMWELCACVSECHNCFISIMDTVYVLLSSFLLIITFAVISIVIRVLNYIFCSWVEVGDVYN